MVKAVPLQDEHFHVHFPDLIYPEWLLQHYVSGFLVCAFRFLLAACREIVIYFFSICSIICLNSVGHPTWNEIHGLLWQKSHLSVSKFAFSTASSTVDSVNNKNFFEMGSSSNLFKVPTPTSQKPCILTKRATTPTSELLQQAAGILSNIRFDSSIQTVL